MPSLPGWLRKPVVGAALFASPVLVAMEAPKTAPGRKRHHPGQGGRVRDCHHDHGPSGGGDSLAEMGREGVHRQLRPRKAASVGLEL